MQAVIRRLALCAAVVSVFGVVAGQALAAGDITISQVYGGGGNAGAPFANDFIELFNRGTSTVSLSGWSVQYTSASGTGSFAATPLTGSIAPGQHFLVKESGGTTGSALPAPDVATGTLNLSATAGKVILASTTAALACNGGSTPCSAADSGKILDLVGYGNANYFEGSAGAPTLSNTTAALRGNNGCTDTDQNSADFASGAPAPRNTASALTPCGGPPANAPVVVSCPSAQTVVAGSSTSFDVSASDVDGRVANIADGSTVTRTAFSPSLAVGATASATFATSSSLAAGSYTITITATNDDVTPQTASCTVSLTVTAPPTIVTIGEVQGSVPDSYTGGAFNSPHVGDTVTVDGVVTELTFEGGNRSFFLQNTPDKADGDPTSSDGVFVFLGHFSTLIGGYTPVVGDEIVMRGKVQEFSGQTELSSAAIDHVVAHGVSIAPFDVSPPAASYAAARYWERHEGMLGAVARGATVDSPVHTYASTSDTEFYVLAPDSPVSGRSDPYAVRAFRDAHPLDDQPGLFDNGNGYRILITDEGVKAAAGNVDVPLAGLHTFQTVAQPLVGGVYYDFGKYSISTNAQPQLDAGVDPSQNDPPAAFDRTKAFSLANFNMENLYDFRNDPFDGCDFTGDPGCPGVTPPFDYPPASDAVYQARETAIAHQVVEDLHAPDVISVAEAEDQDICTVVDWAMSCGSTNNADGKPDTLQEVAVHIHAIGGPDYTAAYDRDGADARGIVSAFLYRTDRVSLATPDGSDAVLGSSPQVHYRGTALPYNTQVSNPKALNAVLPADVDTSTGVDGSNVFTRAPQVGHFLIWKNVVGSGYAQDVWVLANHFTSGPDSNVGQRREQAAYNAAIVAAIQTQDPSAKIDVSGDLNVYPRPDDPFPPPNTSDQLAPLYDGGLHDLFDSVLAAHPSSAYSYDYQGQAQDLDHQFVSDALFGDLLAVNEAHINSDWTPGAFTNRGTSDHDPMVSRWTLNGPPVVSAGGPYTVGEGSSTSLTATATDPDGDPLTYAWDLNGDGTFEAAGQTVPFDATSIDGPADVTVKVQVSDGKLTTTDTTVVHVTNVAPTAAVSGAPGTSPEGTTVTATGSATDPAAADTISSAWSVTKDGAAYASGSGTDIAFTPDDNGTYVIAFTATDDDGGVGTATATVDVTNVAPTVSVTAPESSAEGTAVTASASATDPGTVDGAPAFAWSVTKDGGAYASGTGTSISYTPDDNGAYVLTVTATDKDGGAGAASATTQVANVDPTATFNAPSSAVSGSTFTISLSNAADASPVDAASLQFAFDCGGGYGPYGSAESRACTAAYDGTQTVAGRVRDKDGGVSTYTATVHITVTVDSVCALAQRLAKNAGQANSLCVKLQHGQIAAFDHEVDAQAGKAFTADDAALLERLAGQL